MDRSVQTLPGGDELLGRKLHTRMHPKTRFDLECLYRVGIDLEKGANDR